MCDKADKTDKADNQNGKVTTVKHWKHETKAKIKKHSFETKQNGQSGQRRCEDNDIQAVEI